MLISLISTFGIPSRILSSAKVIGLIVDKIKMLFDLFLLIVYKIIPKEKIIKTINQNHNDFKKLNLIIFKKPFLLIFVDLAFSGGAREMLVLYVFSSNVQAYFPALYKT